MKTLFLDVLTLAFLLANLAVRSVALETAGGVWALTFMALALAGAALSVWRPSLLSYVLVLFAASFPLYGFHSYRVQSQAFEYAVTALALAFLVRGWRARRAGANWPARFWLVWLALSFFSLCLFSSRILEHRFLLEGMELLPNALAVFPRDPMYAFAAVNRLALFVLFAVRLSLLEGARDLYRALFRGVAAGAVASVLLGLLDFSGVISLTPYNLSRLFFGRGYRRLQSTFGNPTWFASFLTCALPFVVLELRTWGRYAPALLGAFLPLCAATLFLSAVRASWLVTGLLVFLAAAWLWRRRTQDVLLPAPKSAGRWSLALAGLIASLVLLGALFVAGSLRGPGEAAERLEGVAKEMEYRGVSSPRSVALAQGFELVKESPFLGSGHETFNVHLRTLLGVPTSGVARVPNPHVAADPRDTLFDDAHSTYLQVLSGTGLLGLACWLVVAAACFLLVAGEWRQERAPLALAVALSMLVFHLYGFFQGMQYVPVVFFLFHLLCGYAMTADASQTSPWFPRVAKATWVVLGVLVLASPLHYCRDRGFCGLREKYDLRAYLPEEAAEFEGFFRPEKWPQGEFRWMGRRGLINVERKGPLELTIACNQPDMDREPVLVSVSFNGKPVWSLRFDRPALQAKTFAFEDPGVLIVTASQTWRPRDRDPAGDSRELGVAISVVRP